MSYKERVDRVIDFIGKHLDEELELDELCRILGHGKLISNKRHYYREQLKSIITAFLIATNGNNC